MAIHFHRHSGGADGDLCLKAGEVVSLTRPMYYRDVRIHPGGRVEFNRHDVYVSGTWIEYKEEPECES